MPFDKYQDFDDCVRQNQDKENPEAYCAAIERLTSGKKPEMPKGKSDSQ